MVEADAAVSDVGITQATTAVEVVCLMLDIEARRSQTLPDSNLAHYRLIAMKEL